MNIPKSSYRFNRVSYHSKKEALRDAQVSVNASKFSDGEEVDHIIAVCPDSEEQERLKHTCSEWYINEVITVSKQIKLTF